MARPWTRSMPDPPEENYVAPPNNNFTQGQSSQQGSEAAFSQVCRLYEQSQQQHQDEKHKTDQEHGVRESLF